jgi:hypothetical protein
MSSRRNKDREFIKLEEMARDISDIRPMSDAMRKRWQAAQQTGKRGRPRKDPKLKARIVAISIKPRLLARSIATPRLKDLPARAL